MREDFFASYCSLVITPFSKSAWSFSNWSSSLCTPPNFVRDTEELSTPNFKIKDMLDAFLKAKALSNERYDRRNSKIKEYENGI